MIKFSLFALIATLVISQLIILDVFAQVSTEGSPFDFFMIISTSNMTINPYNAFELCNLVLHRHEVVGMSLESIQLTQLTGHLTPCE